jgi:hypothetical protein
MREVEERTEMEDAKQGRPKDKLSFLFFPFLQSTKQGVLEN